MTAAQRRALLLLATPGAEAHPRRSLRWVVIAHGEPLGTIYDATLRMLRLAGFVRMYRGSNGCMDVVQRITAHGLDAAEDAP